MDEGSIVLLCSAVALACPLVFGLLTGSMPPPFLKPWWGVAYRDENPTGYWLNGAFYAGLAALACYQAFRPL